MYVIYNSSPVKMSESPVSTIQPWMIRPWAENPAKRTLADITQNVSLRGLNVSSNIPDVLRCIAETVDAKFDLIGDDILNIGTKLNNAVVDTTRTRELLKSRIKDLRAYTDETLHKCLDTIREKHTESQIGINVLYEYIDTEIITAIDILRADTRNETQYELQQLYPKIMKAVRNKRRNMIASMNKIRITDRRETDAIVANLRTEMNIIMAICVVIVCCMFYHHFANIAAYSGNSGYSAPMITM